MAFYLYFKLALTDLYSLLVQNQLKALAPIHHLLTSFIELSSNIGMTIINKELKKFSIEFSVEFA